jgi:hypothetical protein
MSEDPLSQNPVLVYRYDLANVRTLTVYSVFGFLFLMSAALVDYEGLDWTAQAKLVLMILLGIIVIVIILFLRSLNHSDRAEFYEDRIRIFDNGKPIDVAYDDLEPDWKQNNYGISYFVIKVPVKREDGTEHVVVRKFVDMPIRSRKIFLSDFMRTK